MIIETNHLFPLLVQVCSRKDAGRIINLFQFWERTHGLQWTITHIKRFSLLLLGKRSEHFGMRGCLVKGPLRVLHFASKRNRRTLRKVLAILRWHGRYKAQVTHEDYVEQAKEISKDISITPINIVGLIPQAPVKVPSYPYEVEAPPPRMWVYKHYPLFKESRIRGLGSAFSYARFREDSWGTVYGLTKDGSLKKRFVYSPHSSIQFATWPLYWKMKIYVERFCPFMFHKNVEKGKAFISELIRKRSIVMSLDFKAATDFFPLSPQLDVALQLFPEEAKAIKFIRSRGVFKSKCGVRFQHKVGQPMGLRVSFLLFSIYLYEVLKQAVGHGNFCIVGDDVVSAPTTIFGDLGYLVSEDKSLVGPVAEFCGTFIDSIGDFGVSKRYTNPLLFLQTFGRRALFSSYPSYIAKRTWSVSKLPYPHGLRSGLGILARVPWDRVEEVEKKVITIVKPSRKLRRRTTTAFTSILAGMEDHADYLDGFLDDDIDLVEDSYPFSRLSALNCVIEHCNALETGQALDPIIWRIYDLPGMTPVRLKSIPRTKRESWLAKQLSEPSYTIGINTMYNKYRKLFVTAAAAVAAGWAIAASPPLPIGTIAWHTVLEGVNKHCEYIGTSSWLSYTFTKFTCGDGSFITITSLNNKKVQVDARPSESGPITRVCYPESSGRLAQCYDK